MNGIYFSKGHRAQIDRDLYKKNMQECLLNTENLTILPEAVRDLVYKPSEKSDKTGSDYEIVGVVLGIVAKEV